MSAFVVTKTHIDAMVTAGLMWGDRRSPLRWFYTPITKEERENVGPRGSNITDESIALAQERTMELTAETAGRVGAMLMAENVKSVNHRYDDDEWEEPYLFEALGTDIDPVVILKAINCYDYQTCAAKSLGGSW